MNYIFFFPDEMRAQALGCYGNKIVKTPNFDKLANEGVKFENCFVQHPVCSPSRCSLATGLYPHNNGHRTLWNLLQKGEKNLFSYLKNSGYHLQWYGKNDVLSQEYFLELIDNGANGPKPLDGQGRPIEDTKAHYYSFLNTAAENKDEVKDAILTEKACEFLENYREDKPFFLFMPLEYPHPAYEAPKEFYDMYNIDDLEIIKEYGNNKSKLYEKIREYRQLKDLDEEYLKKLQSVYFAMCSFSDYLFGKLMNTLENSKFKDDTTIIFSSDHGDFAGDYGLVEKWPTTFDDVITKIPLIIKTPNCKQGEVYSDLTCLFDIMPTVLELSNINCEHTHFAKSLCPALLGDKTPIHKQVFCEGGYNLNEIHCFEGRAENGSDFMKNFENHYKPKILQQLECPETVCKSVMVRNLDYKLTYRSNNENELYDLKNDELELNNVYGVEKFEKIQNQMEKEILTWYLDTADTVPFTCDPRNTPTQLKE